LDDKLARFIRYIVFCVFFAAGAAAIALSFLITPEMTNYFQSVAMLDKTVRDNEKIQNLIDQYQNQIALIEREPNVLARLRQVALGQAPPPQEGVAYPSDYNPQLAVLARQILNETHPADPNEQTPVWVKRCADTRYRSTLFLAGAGLVLIAFIFFSGPGKAKSREKGLYYR
jgi:hypothetical protein